MAFLINDTDDSLWEPNNAVGKNWKIANPSTPYQKIYDETQASLEKLSGLDELLSGNTMAATELQFYCYCRY